LSINTENITWLEALSVYKQKNILAMLFLGFSAGLPLLLVFGTLSYWLRKEGIDRTTIGFISWVALLYGFKFVWAPFVDRLSIPFLGKLFGQRRSWMLLAQTGIILGLWAIASTSPTKELHTLVLFALVVAFSSATQDISIDAWRIEAVPANQQGAMAGTYQLGYRMGMLLAGAGAYFIAGSYSWNIAYAVMGCAMLIGVITTFIIPEPQRRISKDTWHNEERVINFLHSSTHLPGPVRIPIAWILGAVVCPFVDFFSRNGAAAALIILTFISVFRMSDIAMGVMSGPFYADMQYTEHQIAWASKTFGLFVTIFGALLGGVLVMRYGVMRMLIVSALLVALTNLVFAWLATQEPKMLPLVMVISADNLSGGIAGTSFIAYLSGLTNRAYTATQYALFSSLMVFLPKLVGGFSGKVVDSFGYIDFFIYAALLGTPAIMLSIFLWYRHSRNAE
jgi:PAT family beta-lactamase induction signal transducer AmpG